MINEYEWHKWFAWHPVITKDKKILWMKIVQRKKLEEMPYMDSCGEITYVSKWIYI